MRYSRVMVTGHRPQKLSPTQNEWVTGELERIAVKLRDQNGMQYGISGMAIGADQAWGFATVFAWLELWAFIPFPQQPEKWNERQKRDWEELRGRAAHEVVIAPEFSVGALHARNDAMIGNSDLVVAVYDVGQPHSGTGSAVRKAQALNMPILHVNPVAMRTTMGLQS
jgi:uncharacterized phage-like protein YoqJ